MAEQEEVSQGLEYLRLKQEARSGARWFWWVAGLSAVNTLSVLIGTSWSFVMGLGLTQVFDAFGVEFGGVFRAVAFLLDFLFIAAFVVIGQLAHRSKVAYVIGMALYALDGVLLLVFQDFMSVGFHVLALVFMFKGLQALNRLQKLPAPEVSMEAATAPAPVVPEPETVGAFDAD